MIEIQETLLPNSDNYYRRFCDACTPLFSADAPPNTQRQSAHDLFDLLSELIAYDDSKPSIDQARDTHLPNGKAIAFQGAARCLWEFGRTSKFLRGVEAALHAARARFPGQKLRLLEAGCGPFALLALPLVTRFSPAEVSFTLLDIHRHSLDAARRIVSALGLENYVDNYIEADAARWQCPADARPHVIVSETMQNGLKSEPQVAITRNLAPQLTAGGFFLPEAIILDFGLVSWPLTADGVPQMVCDRVAQLMAFTPASSAHNAAGEFIMPDPVAQGARPSLCTNIRVFGDIALTDNECSLTMPIPIRGISFLPGMGIAYEYHSTTTPGMHFSPVA